MKVSIGIAGAVCAVALMAAPAMAQSQPTTPPTTTFCPGCGPSGSTIAPGTGTLAWAYPEHFCLPTTLNGVETNASNFHVVYGVHEQGGHPVAFTVTVDDVSNAKPLVSTSLDTVQPPPAGKQPLDHVSGTIVRVFPNTTIQMVITAKDTVTGLPVTFGNGKTSVVKQLTCDCPPLTTTTTNVLGPPTSVANTVPGGSVPHSPGSPGITSDALLPATGSDGPNWLAAAGIVLIGAGVIGLAFHRKAKR